MPIKMFSWILCWAPVDAEDPPLTFPCFTRASLLVFPFVFLVFPTVSPSLTLLSHYERCRTCCFTFCSTIVHVRLFSEQFVLLHVTNLTDQS